ncbi:MAG: hypothetical protein ABI609_06125 [Acidobacteriota bacterium]
MKLADPLSPSEGVQTLADPELHWFETADHVPSMLNDIGKPLVCFRRDRGIYFACYLPEKAWYWTGEQVPVPERWAPSEGGNRSWRHRARGRSPVSRQEML